MSQMPRQPFKLRQPLQPTGYRPVEEAASAPTPKPRAVTSARNIEIRRRRDSGETFTDLAHEYGISPGRVRQIYQTQVAIYNPERWARIRQQNRNILLNRKFQRLYAMARSIDSAHALLHATLETE